MRLSAEWKTGFKGKGEPGVWWLPTFDGCAGGNSGGFAQFFLFALFPLPGFFILRGCVRVVMGLAMLIPVFAVLHL